MFSFIALESLAVKTNTLSNSGYFYSLNIVRHFSLSIWSWLLSCVSSDELFMLTYRLKTNTVKLT